MYVSKFQIFMKNNSCIQVRSVTPHNLHITITIKVLPISIQTWSFSKHS